MVIEGWSFMDALFMAITTISTVGYREVQPLSGAGRMFTIVLIVGGVGILFYSVGSFAEYFMEGQLVKHTGRSPYETRHL